MPSPRADVLSNIRRSLGVTGSERIRNAAVQARLAEAPKGVIPQRGQVSGEARAELFKAMVEASLATCARVAKSADVPAEAARYLRDSNLPATLRAGADERLAAMPWENTALEVTSGASQGNDLNAISHAFSGIAETGTLVMLSGADNPTTLNFLPDNHIIAVSESDLAGDIEEVWKKLRLASGKGVMPRALNMITGPSRSGDIEQTLFLGAHGPRNLHVIMVGD